MRASFPWHRRILRLVPALALASAACNTTRPWKSADLLLDRGEKSTSALDQAVARTDFDSEGDYLLIHGESAAKLRKTVRPIATGSAISSLFCWTGFPEHPGLFDGAMRNIFLADRRIEALTDLNTSLESMGSRPQCVKVTATAVEMIKN